MAAGSPGRAVGRWHGADVELQLGDELAGDDALVAVLQICADTDEAMVWLSPTGPVVPLDLADAGAVVAYCRDQLGVEWTEAPADPRLELPDDAQG